MNATEVRVWLCPFGCTSPLETSSIADRWDHCIDLHLDQLKHASAQTLNLIVSPR